MHYYKPQKRSESSIDLSFILPVHRLSISSFSEIKNFHLIGTNKPDILEIDSCDSSIDIEVCKGISNLSLNCCSKIENIDKFSDIKVCKLSSCSVPSVFGSLQVFQLSGCESVTDVGALAHIPDLTLCQCPNIINIDVLTRNNRLNIVCCANIEKISLSNHP